MVFRFDFFFFLNEGEYYLEIQDSDIFFFDKYFNFFKIVMSQGRSRVSDYHTKDIIHLKNHTMKRGIPEYQIIVPRILSI